MNLFDVRIDEDAGGNPWARLGSRPWRSWASAWKRLTAHPLDGNHDKHDMVLDANVDLEALDYSRLEDGEAFILELVTPFVLRSEYPKANNVDVPWWWSVDDEAQLRHRLEKVLEGGNIYELETVDHGVVVGYDGDRPMETAISGLTRVGNHSKYGFGKLRVKPVTPDETNVKNNIKSRSRSTDKRTMTGTDPAVSVPVNLNNVDHIANNC